MREGTAVRVADGRDSAFGSGDSKLLVCPFYRPTAGGAGYAAGKRPSPALVELTFCDRRQRPSKL